MSQALRTLSNEELLARLEKRGSPPTIEESMELVRRGIIYDWPDANPPGYDDKRTTGQTPPYLGGNPSDTIAEEEKPLE